MEKVEYIKKVKRIAESPSIVLNKLSIHLDGIFNKGECSEADLRMIYVTAKHALIVADIDIEEVDKAEMEGIEDFIKGDL